MTDKMTLVPQVDLRTPKARRYAQKQKRSGREKQAGRRMARLRTAVVARRLRTRRRVKSRRFSPVRGAAGAVGTVAKAGLRFNPVALIATIAAGALLAGTRIMTGRSMEGLGNDLEHLLLGDTHVEAKAKMNTRGTIQGGEHIASQVGDAQRVTSDVHEVRRRLEAGERQRLTGEELIKREFDVDSAFDMLAVRIWNGLKGAVTNDTEDRVVSALEAYERARQDRSSELSDEIRARESAR